MTIQEIRQLIRDHYLMDDWDFYNKYGQDFIYLETITKELEELEYTFDELIHRGE